MCDKGTYYEAVEELREIARERQIPELHELLNHVDPAIRAGAAFILREKAGDAGTVGFFDLVRCGVSYDSEIDFNIAYDNLLLLDESAVISAALQALEDVDSDVRRLAVSVLCSFGNPIALPAVIDKLGDPDDFVRETVISCLNFFGKPAIFQMLDLIRSDDAKVRWYMADTFRYTGLSAVDGLLELLKQEDEGKRKSVIDALELLFSDQPIEVATDRLSAALRNENPNVQKGAAEVLLRFQVPDALAAVDEWRRKQQDQQ